MSESDVVVGATDLGQGSASPEEEAGGTSLEQELDRVSLTQALIDTEAATARVIDLTERLIDARTQINDLRRDLEALRIEHRGLQTEHEAMQHSAAFRLATSIWNVRNALRL